MGNHTKSTFLMVFSPDRELLASTHGDHNLYISEVKTGECIQTLRGHPRYEKIMFRLDQTIKSWLFHSFVTFVIHSPKKCLGVKSPDFSLILSIKGRGMFWYPLSFLQQNFSMGILPIIYLKNPFLRLN